YFTKLGGEIRNGLAQLNTNGSLDTGFVPDLGEYSAVESAIAAQPDGKIIIGGFFSGETAEGVRRLNSDGSTDISFATALLSDDNGWISAALVQWDASIMVGGNFDKISDVRRHNVARLIGMVDPALRISAVDTAHVRLTWPVALSNYIVEVSAGLQGAEWQPVTNSCVQIGKDLTVTNDARAPQFFRLKRLVP